VTPNPPTGPVAGVTAAGAGAAAEAGVAAGVLDGVALLMFVLLLLEEVKTEEEYSCPEVEQLKCLPPQSSVITVDFADTPSENVENPFYRAEYFYYET